MTIKEYFLSIGIKESEIDSHCSDLYVLKSKISTKWVESYEFKNQVKSFISEIDNKIWYEIPFGYPEYFEERHNI